MFVGAFTHHHFGNDDDRLSAAERHDRIAEDVVAFLEELFSDGIEFYGSTLGGGWRRRVGKPRGLLSKLVFGDTYVWSGRVRSGSGPGAARDAPRRSNRP